MKYYLFFIVLVVNSYSLFAAPRPSGKQTSSITNPTGLDELEDLSDKELIKAILPHLALVLKSFFCIVQEHQNFSAVITNIGQMVMSFFTIGGYMLRSPHDNQINDDEIVRSYKQNQQNMLLTALVKQYQMAIIHHYACSAG